MLTFEIFECTVDPPPPPPILPISGLTKKQRYWKTVVKGVIIYNQEKTYSGLENQRRYWGGGDQRRGGIGGTVHTTGP